VVELYTYQRAGVDHLLASASKLAYLADDMGLGKTLQAVTTCDELEAEDILVVCPASVRVNWSREIERFQADDSVPINVMLKTDDLLPEWGWVIASYEWVRANADRLKQRDWDVIVLDEAHYVKSPDAARTKAIAGTRGLMKCAKRVLALSGTPMVNNAAELWTLLNAGAPDVIDGMSYWQFASRYCHVVENRFGKQIGNNKKACAAELRERIAPVFLRRTKEEVLDDLPPVRFDTLFVEGAVPPVDEETAKEIAAILEQVETGMSLGPVSDAVATVRRLTGMAKVDAVADVVAADSEASKIIVAAYHRSVIDRLLERLPTAVVLHGGVTADARQEAIDRFQNDDAVRVFIGQITAAGVGVNLTAASNVVFCESSWTPADNAQMAARAHRIGQKNPVLVRFATLAGSIDEQIQKVVVRKARDFADLFE
jgi:SWI/SNF-related matrix-associated actin-dependent regulator 1 of chromatin subfamily A